MRENTDPKNSERGHFSRSDCIHKKADPFCCGYNITELIFNIYCNFEDEQNCFGKYKCQLLVDEF